MIFSLKIGFTLTSPNTKEFPTLQIVKLASSFQKRPKPPLVPIAGKIDL